jgi:hypothetical protein
MTKKRGKIRLALMLKTVSRDGSSATYRKRSSKAFSRFARACIAEEYTIAINYLDFPGVENSGKYNKKEEMLKALTAFTSEDELKFVEKYWS